MQDGFFDFLIDRALEFRDFQWVEELWQQRKQYKDKTDGMYIDEVDELEQEYLEGCDSIDCDCGAEHGLSYDIGYINGFKDAIDTIIEYIKYSGSE